MLSIRQLSQNLRQRVLLKHFSSRTTAPSSIKLVNEKDDIDQNDTVKQSEDPKAAKKVSSQIFAKIKSLQKDDIVVESTETKTDTPDAESKVDVSRNREPKKIIRPPEDLNTFIENANSVSDLLAVSYFKHSKPEHAIKVVSMLSEWTSSNRIKASEFKRSAEYFKLCKLALPVSTSKNSEKPAVVQIPNVNQKSADLNVILNIAADKEAETIIVALQLSQMVKVLSTLAKKKSRNLSLLRVLAYNISSHRDSMNLKECGDVLFAMATLNFHDIILITRVCTDAQAALEQNKHAAPVGSIITSLGHLKYRDTDLLDNLADWIIQRQSQLRNKDLASLFVTLGIVNYQTIYMNELKTKVLPDIDPQEIPSCAWLDLVWALSALDIVEPKQLESVLNTSFIQNLIGERGPNLTPVIKMKLLNLNAYAKYIQPNYTGKNLTETGTVHSIPFAYSKSKQILVESLLNALKSLFTDQSYVRTMHDTNMGFLIDAECVLDKNRLPLDVEKADQNAFRIAFMVLDFPEVCQGNSNSQISGVSALSHRLLERQGYKVIPIPYNEFNSSIKLLKRVEYLDAKLREVVGSKI